MDSVQTHLPYIDWFIHPWGAGGGQTAGSSPFLAPYGCERGWTKVTRTLVRKFEAEVAAPERLLQVEAKLIQPRPRKIVRSAMPIPAMNMFLLTLASWHHRSHPCPKAVVDLRRHVRTKKWTLARSPCCKSSSKGK